MSGSSVSLYLLNGTTIPEETVRELDPNSVNFIDVLKGGQAAIFGGRGATGIIAIYTEMTSSKVRARKPGIVDFDFNGLYRGREFYATDYSKSHEVYSPDLRSTLYWNSDFEIKNGANKLSFYTADGSGAYTVSLQGISETGDIISEKKTFLVK